MWASVSRKRREMWTAMSRCIETDEKWGAGPAIAMASVACCCIGGLMVFTLYVDQCHVGRNNLAFSLVRLDLTTKATDDAGISGAFGNNEDELHLKFTSGLCGATSSSEIQVRSYGSASMEFERYTFFNMGMLFSSIETDAFLTGGDDECESISIPKERLDYMQEALEALEETEHGVPELVINVPFKCFGGDLFSESTLGRIFAENLCVDTILLMGKNLGYKAIVKAYKYHRSAEKATDIGSTFGMALRDVGVEDERLDTAIEALTLLQHGLGFCLSDFGEPGVAQYQMQVKVTKAKGDDIKEFLIGLDVSIWGCLCCACLFVVGLKRQRDIERAELANSESGPPLAAIGHSTVQPQRPSV